MPKHQPPRINPKKASLTPEQIKERQRQKQQEAWEKIKLKTGGKAENLPKKLGKGEAPAAFTPGKLSRTQVKNKLKRERARRPCFRCGIVGHRKEQCTATDSQILEYKYNQNQLEGGQGGEEGKGGSVQNIDSIACLACRSFGHTIKNCPQLEGTYIRSKGKEGEQGEEEEEEEESDSDSDSSENEIKSKNKKTKSSPSPSPSSVPGLSAAAKARVSSVQCYTCGAAGHTTRECLSQSTAFTASSSLKSKSSSSSSSSPSVPPSAYPFAICFICKGQGHISRECPSNTNGIYPKGGKCRNCGDNTHKEKHCPTLEKKGENKGNKGEKKEEKGNENKEKKRKAEINNNEEERGKEKKKKGENKPSSSSSSLSSPSPSPSPSPSSVHVSGDSLDDGIAFDEEAIEKKQKAKQKKLNSRR